MNTEKPMSGKDPVKFKKVKHYVNLVPRSHSVCGRSGYEISIMSQVS